MTTILTEVGWEDENGNLLGTWTNRADLVDEGDEITVTPSVVTVNTRAGNDTITGTGTGGSNGVNNFGTLNTGNGKDTITGTDANIGIRNVGILNTGNGKDTITGNATGSNDGLINEGLINTGAGKDIITGTSAEGSGIRNLIGVDESIINTGNGNDTITGTGDQFGLVNERLTTIDGTIINGIINTGNGRDTITGIGGSIGIANAGIINTGNGRDTVDALTGGFDSVGEINLGRGRDLIRGFGQQIVDGGRGFDTAELGIDFDENQITFGSTGSTSIDITFDSATMSFDNVERFDFNGQVFALEQLQDLV